MRCLSCRVGGIRFGWQEKRKVISARVNKIVVRMQISTNARGRHKNVDAKSLGLCVRCFLCKCLFYKSLHRYCPGTDTVRSPLLVGHLKSEFQKLLPTYKLNNFQFHVLVSSVGMALRKPSLCARYVRQLINKANTSPLFRFKPIFLPCEIYSFINNLIVIFSTCSIIS